MSMRNPRETCRRSIRIGNQRGDVSNLSLGGRRFGGPKIISYDSGVLSVKTTDLVTPDQEVVGSVSFPFDRMECMCLRDGVRCGVHSHAQNVRESAQDVLKCATC